MKKIVTKYVVCYSNKKRFNGSILEINIKYRQGIKIYSSMHTLLKILLWNIVFFDIIMEFCVSAVVLPVFLCRAHWPEYSQTLMNKQN